MGPTRMKRLALGMSSCGLSGQIPGVVWFFGCFVGRLSVRCFGALRARLTQIDKVATNSDVFGGARIADLIAAVELGEYLV